MSRRGVLAGAVAAFAVGVAGCGGDEPARSGAASAPATATDGERLAAALPEVDGLVWKGTPNVFAPDGLPRDKILTGTIRNASGGPIDLRVDRVDVKDAKGRSLGANVRFVGSFGHGLYGPGGPPAPLQASRYDQARLGERLTLPANADRPMTVAWRVPKGRGQAAAIVVSDFILPVP